MSAKKKQAKRAKAKPVKKLATRAEQRAVAKLSKAAPSTPTTNGVASVSFKDAMKQTGRSMGHIYRCINDGRLPAFKVGRNTVFRQTDIDKLLVPVPYTPTKLRVYTKRKAKVPGRVVARGNKPARNGIVKKAKAALALVKAKPATPTTGNA